MPNNIESWTFGLSIFICHSNIIDPKNKRLRKKTSLNNCDFKPLRPATISIINLINFPYDFHSNFFKRPVVIWFPRNTAAFLLLLVLWIAHNLYRKCLVWTLSPLSLATAFDLRWSLATWQFENTCTTKTMFGAAPNVKWLNWLLCKHTNGYVASERMWGEFICVLKIWRHWSHLWVFYERLWYVIFEVAEPFK